MGAGDSIPVINVRTILYMKRELMHRDLKLGQEKNEKNDLLNFFFFEVVEEGILYSPHPTDVLCLFSYF